MSKFIKLDDNLGIKRDALSNGQNKTFRTSIDAIDQFGNVIFTKKQNNVVLEGSIYVLEKLLNVRSALQVASLNEIMAINNETASFTATDVIPAEHFMCLWGVGIGGSGDSIGSTRTVNFYEREVGSRGNSSEMVPFRVVDTALTGTDAKQYFFRKDMGNNKYGYYLKAFQSTPTIKVLWNDGVDGEDGTEVTADVYNTERTDGIEVFAEIILQLTKKDIREYFNFVGQIEKARVNTIALCTGIKKEIASGVYDYSNVGMCTKLNFGNEMLENKEITFRYRIFTN